MSLEIIGWIYNKSWTRTSESTPSEDDMRNLRNWMDQRSTKLVKAANERKKKDANGNDIPKKDSNGVVIAGQYVTEEYEKRVSPDWTKIPLVLLNLPATHNSGCYPSAIQYEMRPWYHPGADNKKLGSAVQCLESLHRNKNLINFPAFLEKWTLTQKWNFYNQLRMGIRVFEWNICKDTKDKWRLEDSFYLDTITDVMKQFNKFFKEYPREVVIIKYKVSCIYTGGSNWISVIEDDNVDAKEFKDRIHESAYPANTNEQMNYQGHEASKHLTYESMAPRQVVDEYGDPVSNTVPTIKNIIFHHLDNVKKTWNCTPNSHYTTNKENVKNSNLGCITNFTSTNYDITSSKSTTIEDLKILREYNAHYIPEEEIIIKSFIWHNYPVVIFICLVLIIVLSIDYVIRPKRDRILKNLLISPLWWICICLMIITITLFFVLSGGSINYKNGIQDITSESNDMMLKSLEQHTNKVASISLSFPTKEQIEKIINFNNFNECTHVLCD
jgi:hypothetical protein